MIAPLVITVLPVNTAIFKTQHIKVFINLFDLMVIYAHICNLISSIPPDSNLDIDPDLLNVSSIGSSAGVTFSELE